MGKRALIKPRSGTGRQWQNNGKEPATDSGWKSPIEQILGRTSMPPYTIRTVIPTGHMTWCKRSKRATKSFHYKGSAIVGVSRATGQAWFDDVIWAARGSASRNARNKIAPAAGAVCSAQRMVAVEPALSLADLRSKEAEIMRVRDRLGAKKDGALRFPFVRYGDQGLPAFQAYLVEFPTDVAELFPSLMRAVDRLDVRLAGTEKANVSDQVEVATIYRAADEHASAATRDPFFVDPALVERGCRGHAFTQNALADFLRVRGIEPLSPSSPQINFDVGWRAAGRFFVAEVKSCTNANVEKQLRLGLGQVLRYRSVLEDVLDCSVVAVLALEADFATLLGISSVTRLASTLSSRRNSRASSIRLAAVLETFGAREGNTH